MWHAPTQRAWRQPLGDRQPRRIDRFGREVRTLAGDALAPDLDTVDIFELQEKDASVGRDTGRDFKRLSESQTYLAECDTTEAQRHG